MLLREVEESFVGLDRLRAEAARLRDFGAGSIRIASLAALAATLVPRAIRSFQQRRPDIAVPADSGINGRARARQQWWLRYRAGSRRSGHNRSRAPGFRQRRRGLRDPTWSCTPDSLKITSQRLAPRRAMSIIWRWPIWIDAGCDMLVSISS
jgi:hypothetical protein